MLWLAALQVAKANLCIFELADLPKILILLPTPTNSVLKYLILLLQHASKLKSISDVNGNSFLSYKMMF